MEELDEIWEIRLMAGRDKTGLKTCCVLKFRGERRRQIISVLKFPIQCLLVLMEKLDWDTETAVTT